MSHVKCSRIPAPPSSRLEAPAGRSPHLMPSAPASRLRRVSCTETTHCAVCIPLTSYTSPQLPIGPAKAIKEPVPIEPPISQKCRDEARDDTLLLRADRLVLWLAHVDPCLIATGLEGVVTRNERRSAGRVRPSRGWCCRILAAFAAASCTLAAAARWRVPTDAPVDRERKRDRRYRNTSLMSRFCSHSSWLKAAAPCWLVVECASGPGATRAATSTLPACWIVGLNCGSDVVLSLATALLPSMGSAALSGMAGSPAYGSGICCIRT